MRMQDPKPTFTHLVSSIRQKHPNLSYLHVVEPRIFGDSARGSISSAESNDFLREIWQPKPFISAGNYNRESAMKVADATGELVAFGRSFISNVSPFTFINIHY
jgi:NADPH2 dehydrogenase